MAIIRSNKPTFIPNEFNMQQVIAKFFGYYDTFIIPNCTLSNGGGLGFNEADLVVISKSLYLHEIEIKISNEDIKRDKLKYKTAHKNQLTKYFSYAIPEKLINSEHIPLNSGLIVVDKYGCVKTVRPPIINKNARKLTDKEFFNLLSFCNYKMWNLRNKLQCKNLKTLYEQSEKYSNE